MSKLIKKYGMAMVAILMIVGFSAFKVVEKKNDSKTEDILYFEYIGNEFTNADYLNANKWVHENSPIDCPGIGRICVLKIDESLLSGSGSLEEQLADYLSNLSSPSTFVDDPMNMLFEQL